MLAVGRDSEAWRYIRIFLYTHTALYISARSFVRFVFVLPKMFEIKSKPYLQLKSLFLNKAVDLIRRFVF